jgi:hypothetical protein
MCRLTAVFMPFSVHTMAWSCEHRAFVVEEFIQNGGSDEAHFHLSGTVNKQNFRYWSHSNPWELHQRPLHSPKVTVWCAIFEFGMWGPYFFEEDNVTVTVTSDRYCAMLENFLQAKLDDLR